MHFFYNAKVHGMTWIVLQVPITFFQAPKSKYLILGNKFTKSTFLLKNIKSEQDSTKSILSISENSWLAASSTKTHEPNTTIWEKGIMVYFRPIQDEKILTFYNNQ